MEKEGPYLVPRLRDLAFSVDIGYNFHPLPTFASDISEIWHIMLI